MIVQVVSPNDFAAGAPAFDGGSAYAVRIVQFSAGATIAFDNPKSQRKIYGYFAYRNGLRTGWKQIYLTGSCVVEIATSPDESFGGSGVAGVNAIDGNQNTIVVGPDADGIAPTANPVQLAGYDRAGALSRRLSVDAGGILVPGGDPAVLSYYLAVSFTLGTAAAMVLAMEASATKKLRLRRWRVRAAGISATAAASIYFILGRTTAASTGGAVRTPLPAESSDAAFGGIVRDTAPGTTPASFTFANALDVAYFDSPAVANIQRAMLECDKVLDGRKCKPVTVQAGVGNGLAVYCSGPAAGQTGGAVLEFWFTEGE